MRESTPSLLFLVLLLTPALLGMFYPYRKERALSRVGRPAWVKARKRE